jgi:transposase
MREKKIWGRKRHLLVDTLGLLICVKVLAADITDREGGKVLLTALSGKLPRLLLIWADSGYEGKFESWVKEQLGVRLEIVKHPWTGLRGVWAPQGAKVDWDQILPKGFHVLRRQMGGRTHECLDHAPPPALPRF